MTKKKSKSDENDNNEIINFYELKKVKKFTKTGINPNYEKHGIKVPFRALLIGSSGVGKTNLLLNIINKMAVTHIYIYTKATEPLYDYLTSQLSTDLLTISYDLDSLRKFDDDDYYGQSLVIFDDMVNEKNQQVISELYIRGRKIKGGISLLYLTQSYFHMDKNLIRNNFRQKVFSLFNNDPEDANEFIENFNEDYILLFDSVYNQLKKTFSGSNQSPQVILNTTYQLMNNLDQTGVISQTSNNKQTRAIIDNISEIKDFIENQYKNKNMSKSTGDSMMHVLDAITAYDNFDYDTLKLSSKWTSFKQKIQPFVNEIIEIMISNNDNKINNINIIFQNVRDLLKKTIDSLTPEEIAEIQAKSKAEAQEKVTSVSNKKIKADEKVTNRQIKADKKEVGAVMESLLKSVVNKAKAEAKAEPKAKAKPKAKADNKK